MQYCCHALCYKLSEIYNKFYQYEISMKEYVWTEIMSKIHEPGFKIL